MSVVTDIDSEKRARAAVLDAIAATKFESSAMPPYLEAEVMGVLSGSGRRLRSNETQTGHTGLTMELAARGIGGNNSADQATTIYFGEEPSNPITFFDFHTSTIPSEWRARLGGHHVQVHGFALPSELGVFIPAIECSRAMLELEDDWDDEGSSGYAEETWRRAVGVALASAGSYLRTRLTAPPTPAFSKGPEGSVDILWWSDGKRLMVNVPAEDNEPVTYHGYDRGNPSRETKGALDPSDDNEWMLGWLTE